MRALIKLSPAILAITGTLLLTGCFSNAPDEADLSQAWNLAPMSDLGLSALVAKELGDYRCSENGAVQTCVSTLEVTRMYSFGAMPNVSTNATDLANQAVARGYDRTAAFAAVSSLAKLDSDFRACDEKSMRPAMELKKEFDFQPSGDTWVLVAERNVPGACSVFGL